jgi:hypothetical protein
MAKAAREAMERIEFLARPDAVQTKDFVLAFEAGPAATRDEFERGLKAILAQR